ncbi:major facilitator superfamily domain-containing protein 12 isoform X2 [Nematostella vectensis]|uniref:major facilitator superfamily domain-containing protein 12 isoform X2 n=1 Tax=Nematostella vectensis TaxID=45351 RepID=UPI0020772E01|nr:major facilitator superfamily domain-containing protein 12 isoform X2 [Nematostella vectensis]
MSTELSWRCKFSYSSGHVLNDLCAGLWFTYLLIFLNKVALFTSSNSGTLLLIGQLVDACVTPFVAMDIDRIGNWRYGRRKVWHLIGSLMVAVTFPFIFSPCLGCLYSKQWAKFFYYVPFIFIMQVGWGITQISHLSLIPVIAGRMHGKVELNAGRYAATVASNIFVFIITWIMLDAGKEELDPNMLSKSDSKAFMYVVFIVVGVGLVFVAIFHVGVKEKPRDCSHEFATASSKRSASNWKMWFRVPLFYQTAILYMCTRLIVNITQVYIPMYTLETLHLTKDKIAIMPLIIYVSGFLSTFLSKPMNKLIGRKGVFLYGLAIIFAACVWMWFLPARNAQVYGVSVLIGIGGSTLLVTALTMLADLIGENVETGAFVYGAMSFMDKMSNGIVVQIVQAFYPKSSPSNPDAGDTYYRGVMVFIAGGAAVLALVTLATTINRTPPPDAQTGTHELPAEERRRLLTGPSIDQSLDFGMSWSLVFIKGPLTPYEPIDRTCSFREDKTEMADSGTHRHFAKHDIGPSSYDAINT